MTTLNIVIPNEELPRELANTFINQLINSKCEVELIENDEIEKTIELVCKSIVMEETDGLTIEHCVILGHGYKILDEVKDYNRPRIEKILKSIINIINE